MPSIVHAPKGAQWWDRGVCTIVSRYLMKTTRATLTPLGPLGDRIRHMAAFQHKQPKPTPLVTRLSTCLDSSPPFVQIVAWMLCYTTNCYFSRRTASIHYVGSVISGTSYDQIWMSLLHQLIAGPSICRSIQRYQTDPKELQNMDAIVEAGPVYDEPSSPSRPHSYKNNVRIILLF